MEIDFGLNLVSSPQALPDDFSDSEHNFVLISNDLESESAPPAGGGDKHYCSPVSPMPSSGGEEDQNTYSLFQNEWFRSELFIPLIQCFKTKLFCS